MVLHVSRWDHGIDRSHGASVWASPSNKAEVLTQVLTRETSLQEGEGGRGGGFDEVSRSASGRAENCKQDLSKVSR